MRCIAASTTETKTTPPLEKVPRHARCGEVRRSACRLSDKTARPFRGGHSVDIPVAVTSTRIPAPRRMATSLFGGSKLQASRPQKRLDLLRDWSCPNLTPFFSRKQILKVPQRQNYMAIMAFFRPHWARWWRCCSGAPLSAVRAPDAPWHRPPGDHCCPCNSTGLSQHLRGESLQPSHSNCSRLFVY
ncbi:hypothetical protein TcCL_NonESM08172 [Trypanosoma cruzi]|nr:hypothetical protein TcCL_NonESM08172 [Trypanosoma cruzi]